MQPTSERSMSSSTETPTPAPAIISPILAWIRENVRKIPKTALIGVVRFLGSDAKDSAKPYIDALYSPDSEQGAEWDADFDAALTAIAQKDYATVGALCRKYGIERGSLPGYIIERLCAPIEEGEAVE